MTSPAERRILQVANDRACSGWLKTALETAIDRDLVDAVNDAEMLTNLLKDLLAEQFHATFVANDPDRCRHEHN